VRLALEGFRLPGQQPAERQRGRGPFDEHGVLGRGLAVADGPGPLAPVAGRPEKPTEPVGPGANASTW
jgi:hypothetical protein